MKQIYLCTVLVAAVTAGCDKPTPPTISAADAVAARDEAKRVALLPKTAAVSLPAGLATFTGKMGGGVVGDIEGSVLGDMTMSVQFTDNTITGSVTNINFIDDDGTPNQLLGGSLTIAGTETDGVLSGTMMGNLTGVGSDVPLRGGAAANLGFSGHSVTDATAADSVYGSVSGSARGDFTITMASGEFYAKQ